MCACSQCSRCPSESLALARLTRGTFLLPARKTDRIGLLPEFTMDCHDHAPYRTFAPLAYLAVQIHHNLRDFPCVPRALTTAPPGRFP